MAEIPNWLTWARELAAIAQTGERYASDPRYGGNPFDVQRYRRVREIAAEIFEAGGVAGAGELLESQTGDATPKVDVRAVVANDGRRLLLVRELLDGGRWTLPGGWADVNESPSQAIEREVLEETGYVVRARKLLAVYDRDRHHRPGPFSTYKLFFWCDLVGGEARDSDETSGARFFAADEIPAELSEGRVTHAQIARFLEHLRNPAWPTDFD